MELNGIEIPNTEYSEAMVELLQCLPLTERETLCLTADFLSATDEQKKFIITEAYECGLLRLMDFYETYTRPSDEASEVMDMLAATILLTQVVLTYPTGTDEAIEAFGRTAAAIDAVGSGELAFRWAIETRDGQTGLALSIVRPSDTQDGE